MFWRSNGSRQACDRAQRLLADQSVGLLRSSRERWLAKHLAECPECAHEQEVLQRVLALVDAVPPVAPPRDLWVGVEQRIHQEEKARATPRGAFPAAKGRRWRALAPALATGAAVVLVAGMGLRGTETTPPPLPSLSPETIGYLESHSLLKRAEPFSDPIGQVSFVTVAAQRQWSGEPRP